MNEISAHSENKSRKLATRLLSRSATSSSAWGDSIWLSVILFWVKAAASSHYSSYFVSSLKNEEKFEKNTKNVFQKINFPSVVFFACLLTTAKIKSVARRACRRELSSAERQKETRRPSFACSTCGASSCAAPGPSGRTGLGRCPDSPAPAAAPPDQPNPVSRARTAFAANPKPLQAHPVVADSFAVVAVVVADCGPSPPRRIAPWSAPPTQCHSARTEPRSRRRTPTERSRPRQPLTLDLAGASIP